MTNGVLIADVTNGVLIAIIFGSAIVAYFAGVFFGNAVRMKEHGWKLGFVLATIAMATSIVSLLPIKKGIDLRGGVILVYEIDEETTRSQTGSSEENEESEDGQPMKIDMGTMIESISRRINPGGVREVAIRPYGSRQIEIIVPDVSDAEIKQIKEDISTTGFLNFRIVAIETRNAGEWEVAKAGLEAGVLDDVVKDPTTGKKIGEWVGIGREEGEFPEGELAPLKFSPQQLAGFLTREKAGDPEVFVLYDETFDVSGGDLRNIAGSYDRQGNPSVSFSMSTEGAMLFGGLTSTNLPDSGGKAPLGIVMDGKLISAPVINSTINSNGVIEGRFTQTEVDSLVRVLRSGKLPAVLYKYPISENKISALLGQDTIRKGTWAIAASLIGVLVFMLLYYRFAGLVACLALVANIVLILGLMILMQAALSLPGLAGLVLTVGMSVDANVLIFERIREELEKGAALRMAIRNGFQRATSTIVDANLTSLITAVVLYVVGTEVIKGFAITLILGILMSLFTAIFCSRIIFDIAERQKWITKLNMAHALGRTKFNFIGMRKAAAALSLAAIILGLGAAVMRGNDIFDIDFTGGTSVTMKLDEATPIGDVRSSLAAIVSPDDVKSVSVTEVRPEDSEESTVYKIDAAFKGSAEQQSNDGNKQKLQDKLNELFGTKIKKHSMDFSAPTGLQGSLTPTTNTTAAQADQPALTDQSFATPASSSTLHGVLLAQATDTAGALDAIEGAAADLQGAATEVIEGSTATADEATTADADAADAEAASESTTAAEATPSIGSDERSSVLTVPGGITGNNPTQLKIDYQSKSTLSFDEGIGQLTVRKMIEQAAVALELGDPNAKLSNEKWDGKSDKGFKEWEVQFATNAADTSKILGKVKEDFSSTPVWLSSSAIGSKVAGDMKASAITAILVSLLGIVGYIWIRFQRIGFGLAAVVALVHDVAITLGAIAISAWLAKSFGFLLIDEFRISLPIVAAFLTIIGYSLNDTIVVFDRIREVKGKSPDLTEDMINTSINQTLSRTLLTSVTTLIVVIILYCFGGQGIHGFAFALMIGVLVGTYSSIFVASPALLWLSGSDSKSNNSPKKKKQKVGAA